MPNATELAAATGLTDRRAGVERLRTLGAGSVVATFGAEGLTADTYKEAPADDGARIERAYRMAAVIVNLLRPLTWRGWLSEPVTPVNPTGAGDACAAAVAAGLARDASWPESLRDAVAWSAASVTAAVAGVVDAQMVARIMPNVRVEEFDDPRSNG